MLIGLFKKRIGDLGSIGGLVRTGNIPIAPEPSSLDALPPSSSTSSDIKVVFAGCKNNFLPFNRWHDYLLSELQLITKPKYLELADSCGEIPVALCVRCGNDFHEPTLDNGRLKPRQKTPVSWFIQCLQLIRHAVGYPCKAVVVSDGSKEQLRELLALDNMHFVRPGAAISDLLVLSRAKVLLGSGSSSFAAWGCFLGQMPSISHPGQPFNDWGISPTRGQYIGEFDPSDPSPQFMHEVRERLLDGSRQDYPRCEESAGARTPLSEHAANSR
jgi:hypothetical protein